MSALMTEKTMDVDEAFDLVIGDLEAEMPVEATDSAKGPYPSCVPGGYCVP